MDRMISRPVYVLCMTVLLVTAVFVGMFAPAVSGPEIVDARALESNHIEGFENGTFSSYNSQTDGVFVQSPVYAGEYALKVKDFDSPTWAFSNRKVRNVTVYTYGSNFAWRVETQDQTALLIDCFSNDGDVLKCDQGNGYLNVEYDLNLRSDRWYELRYFDLNYTSGTFDVTITDTTNGTVMGNATDVGFDTSENHADGVSAAGLGGKDVDNYYIDEIWIDTSSNDIDSFNAGVNGTVTDSDGQELEGVYINVSQSGSEVANDTTSADGSYDVRVGSSGTYNVTASKAGYINDTKSVALSDDTKTVDFELVESEEELLIDVKAFMKHGTTQSYSILFRSKDSSGTFSTTDVTDSATLTSNDTSVISVNIVTEELEATHNESKNKRVVLTANYTAPDGDTFTTTKNVTVANQTLENIVILPGPQRIAGTFGADSTGASDPMLAILTATLVGIVAARASSSFGGISGMVMALIVAWFGGFISTGLMLVAVLAGTFIGLNVASNVQYTRRAG